MCRNDKSPWITRFLCWARLSVVWQFPCHVERKRNISRNNTFVMLSVSETSAPALRSGWQKAAWWQKAAGKKKSTRKDKRYDAKVRFIVVLRLAKGAGSSLRSEWRKQLGMTKTVRNDENSSEWRNRLNWLGMIKLAQKNKRERDKNFLNSP